MKASLTALWSSSEGQEGLAGEVDDLQEFDQGVELVERAKRLAGLRRFRASAARRTFAVSGVVGAEVLLRFGNGGSSARPDRGRSARSG